MRRTLGEKRMLLVVSPYSLTSPRLPGRTCGRSSRIVSAWSLPVEFEGMEVYIYNGDKLVEHFLVAQIDLWAPVKMIIMGCFRVEVLEMGRGPRFCRCDLQAFGGYRHRRTLIRGGERSAKGSFPTFARGIVFPLFFLTIRV